MSYTIESPFQYFPDPSKFGAIGLGQLYIGIVNGNPYLTPAHRQQAYIAVQGGADLAIPQPISLGAGGVPMYNGSPCTLKISSEYSVAVVDYLGAQVYYSPRNGEEITAFADIDVVINDIELTRAKTVNTWADISSVLPTVAGQLFNLAQHTSGGLGGGTLMAFVGSVTDDGGTQKNCLGGFYLKRISIGYDELTPAMFGALTTQPDSTSFVQLFADAMSSTGIAGNGCGLSYNVTTVNFGSNTILSNLICKSVTSSSLVSFIPVFEIDGTVSAKQNMRFTNVSADGNRSGFSNVNLAAGEDGGMHGWRVVANAAGGVINIKWVDCHGINCASAGLAMHSVAPTVATADYPIKNLSWIGGSLKGNREHGWFADAFDGLKVSGVDCTNNGNDLNLTDPLSHGNRGARAGGYLFGAGFDVESYSGYNGSLWKNLTVERCDTRLSAMPALLYNPINTNVAGYQPHSGISINNCNFDGGTATGADRAPSTDYSFYALGSYVSPVYPYSDLIMFGNTFTVYPPLFNGVSFLSITGGRIQGSGGVKARVYNCKHWGVDSYSTSMLFDVVPAVNLTLTKTQGTVGTAITVYEERILSSNSSCDIEFWVKMTITGGLNADGDVIYTFPSPIAGYKVKTIALSANSPANAARACSSIVGTTSSLIFDTISDLPILAEVVINMRAE